MKNNVKKVLTVSEKVWYGAFKEGNSSQPQQRKGLENHE